MYWVEERERIRIKKEANRDKPWTADPVFQETYFCNVHREDDKVTRFIRSFYSPYVDHPLFEYNVILSRFINWPDTIDWIDYQNGHHPTELQALLEKRASNGNKVWGDAYVITTHGLKMPKAQYLCENVLGAAYKAVSKPEWGRWGHCCALAGTALREIEGVGNFLSGQIVADLKNTLGHPLNSAYDKETFVVSGPGSLRGLSWVFFGEPKGVGESSFHHYFNNLREWVDKNWPADTRPVDNQDLQNCLCEFDKYCRVVTQTGRSKRKYNGFGR